MAQGQRRTTRRTFVREAGIGAAATAGALARPRFAFAGTIAPRKKVAVFGAGVAGMTAAHELAERGFDVTVYERRQIGGKARSFDVPGTAADGRAPLPGEHSPYIVLGSYRGFPDTLGRIPVPGNANGVLDNVVPAPELGFARRGPRDFVAQLGGRHGVQPHPDLVVKILRHVPPREGAYLMDRIGVLLTSCDERMMAEWEQMAWWDFLGAGERSYDYQQIAVRSFTEHLAAQDPRTVSARAYGLLLEGFYAVLADNASPLPMISVYNAPKQEALFDPWVAHLQSLGVTFRVGHALAELQMSGGRVSAASVTGPSGDYMVEADYYVSALPVERALPMFNPDVIRADPTLDLDGQFLTRWSNAVSYFLRARVPSARGWVSYVDSPWSIVAYTQAQFWAGHDFARDFGDGTVRDCLSSAISNFDNPGILYGKPARACSPEEILKEVWAQMNQHLGDRAGPRLPESLIASTYIDPGLEFGPGGIVHNDDPIGHNMAGYYLKRPTPRTAIPNLMLAGDWVRTDFPPPTQEAANESGRKAVNAILDASGSNAERCKIFPLYKPKEFAAARRIDEIRFRAGMKNALDVPFPA
jgi:uncharacterized protein with NAD-binding domain and iron-sulfur cluster